MITAGSLFTGAGGQDLGFERAGIRSRWMCEKDERARFLLRTKWPGVPIYHDVRQIIGSQIPPVDVIHGGDPCPRHSRANQNQSRSPDLSGYFLAVVAGCRPRWVVRENVLAPTVDDFATALEAIGYGVVVIGIDAAEITGQSRPREFVVGRRETDRRRVREYFQDAEESPLVHQAALQPRQVAPCLCTNPRRLSHGELLVWEHSGNGLRSLDSQERERLAGLPTDWTAGFSREARGMFTGNAVVPQKATWIADRIVLAERNALG